MTFTCIVPRVLEGWLAGLIYEGLRKKEVKGSVLIANLSCPILNTLLFMTCIVAFFYNTDYVQGFAATLHAGNPIMFVVLFVGINGIVEILACGFIGTAISKALLHMHR